MAIAQLCAERNIFIRHVVVGRGGIPSRELVARVLSKVGRAGGGRSAVDGWQQGQVPARVAHLSAAKGDRVLVLVPPNTVVRHPANEVLLVCRSSSGRSR